MAADAKLSRIRPIAERVVASHGLDLFDLQMRRESIGWVMRVVIDRPPVIDAEGHVEVEAVERAIGIDECQRVSEDLGTVLDVEDAVDVEYTLEVSSPGIDRPLRGPRDYERFRGRLAKIVVTAPVNGQSHFEGRIEALEAGDIVLRAGTKEKRIPLALVSRARLAVEF
ncbi:MAG: ribosome maturation factor RimP [Vicinamibacterales bacterium]|nr:ribosome maturation factor RimP [Vicinamibacterales bacterium]